MVFYSYFVVFKDKFPRISPKIMIDLRLKLIQKLVLILVFPSLSFAQSAMVETENSSALDCYQGATSVAMIEGFEVTSSMLESCNVALIEVGLPDDDRAATFVNRGILYAASGLLAEALSDYEEALNLQADLGQIYINRGIVYHFEKQFDLALADYNHALELNVQSKHLVYFARGLINEEMNLWDQAIRDYGKSLEHSPDWLPAKTRLQWVLDKVETLNYEIVATD